MKIDYILLQVHNYISYKFRQTIMTYKTRMALYRMLEKMTNRPAMLQINEAVEELRGLEIKKDYKSRLWYVLNDVMEQMRNSDANFAKSLSKYVPEQDMMIISASENDDITIGFTTVIANNIQNKKMKDAFISALAYPILMLVVLFSLLFYFSTSVIPVFVESISDGVLLSTTSEILITMSNNFNWWFSCLMIIASILFVFIMWALPNLSHGLRRYLEDIPPFNMYRVVVGCGFLFALGSLAKAGFKQDDSLEQMVHLAKPYLRYRIKRIQDLMADGMDIGQALVESKLNFPDKQMVIELAIQTKYSEEDSLEVLSNTLAEDGLASIKRQANSMRFIITFIVFSTIGFLYFGVYQFGADLGNVVN